MDIILFPLYLLYRMGSHIKNSLFRLNLLEAKRAPLPTVSVGNLTFGGSNKTPLAAHLATFLRRQGYKPALLSRGYKGNWEKTGGVLSDGENLFGDWKDSGDEPFMLATDMAWLGIFIGKNRLSSCQKAHELGFDIAVLDDGFQHRRLQKDVDIIIWRPEEKIALRESLRSLKRADILLVEKSLFVPAEKFISRKAFPGKLFAYSVTSQGLFSLKDKGTVPLSEVKDKRILAMAGIARPERFFSLLQKLGLSPLATLVFPDHSSYLPQAVEKILSHCAKLEADVIITTQKDSVKLEKIKELEKQTIQYLRIGLDIEEGFEQEVLRFLQRASIRS
jgi:tetraacyldisaccharide 4'-kinase